MVHLFLDEIVFSSQLFPAFPISCFFSFLVSRLSPIGFSTKLFITILCSIFTMATKYYHPDSVVLVDNYFQIPIHR